MTNRYIEDLLRDVFAAQGAVDAAGLARRAAKDFDMAERDRKILAWRWEGVTVLEIKARTGLSVQRIKQIQKEQTALLREVSRAS